MYVQSKEVVDSQLLDDFRDLFLSCCYDQVGAIAGKDPMFEVLDAVYFFKKVGKKVGYEGLKLFYCVNITRVPIEFGLGRVLHFFSCIGDELSGRIVAQDGVVVLGSPQVIAYL